MAQRHRLVTGNFDYSAFSDRPRLALCPGRDIRRRDDCNLMAARDQLFGHMINHFLDSTDSAEVLRDEHDAHHRSRGPCAMIRKSSKRSEKSRMPRKLRT